MKTSFYFVVWIMIYPLLELIGNSFINNNDFVVALAAVWGLSWLINRLIPQTLIYDRASETAPVLEEIYTGNVAAFKKRLSRNALLKTVTALYFLVTTIVIAFAVFRAGVNDWIALAVFGFFTIGTIVNSVDLVKANARLKSNPTQEQCVEIAEDTLKMNYASYYEERSEVSYQQILPPRPRWFTVYKVFSGIVAIIAVLLGLWFIVSGVLIKLGYSSLAAGALAGMYFLYGSLAAYFGVKDFISCLTTKTKAGEAVKSAE